MSCSFSSINFFAVSDAPLACFNVAVLEASNVACLEMSVTKRLNTLKNKENTLLYLFLRSTYVLAMLVYHFLSYYKRYSC